MKNTIKLFAFLFALSFTATAYGQGAYVRLGAGYHFGAFQTNMGTSSTTTGTGTTSESINYSLGGGIPISLGIGMDFTDNLALDLGFDYWLGSKVETGNSTNSTLTPTYNQTTETYTRQMRLTPSIKISTGNEGLDLYSRVGVVLPIGGTTYSDVTIDYTTQIEGTYENKGKFGLGYTGALGLNLGLSDNLSFYGEVAGISLGITGESQELTKYDVDGNDGLAALPTSSKETTYVDELTPTSNTDPTQPAEVIATSSSFGSWGINVGIKFNF